MTLHDIFTSAVNADLTPFLTVLKWIGAVIGGFILLAVFEEDAVQSKHPKD